MSEQTKLLENWEFETGDELALQRQHALAASRQADAMERIAAAHEKERFDPNCDRCGEPLLSHRCE